MPKRKQQFWPMIILTGGVAVAVMLLAIVGQSNHLGAFTYGGLGGVLGSSGGRTSALGGGTLYKSWGALSGWGSRTSFIPISTLTSSADPLAGVPPCSGVDPEKPTSTPKPVGSIQPIPSNESIPPDNMDERCSTASCAVPVNGQLKWFSGDKRCIEAQEASCRFDGVSGITPEVFSCPYKFFGEAPNIEACNPVLVPNNFDRGCDTTNPPSCPSQIDTTISETACGACFDWKWDSKKQDHRKFLRCRATQQKEVSATVNCAYIPSKSGQDGWQVDRSACGFDENINDCIQSCRVIYRDSKNGCQAHTLQGQCTLQPDPFPSGQPSPSQPLT